MPPALDRPTAGVRAARSPDSSSGGPADPILDRPSGGVRAALGGIIAVGVALGVGELAAGLTGPETSPALAVADAAVDASPRATTEFAISAFGANDKLALLIGLLLLLGVAGAGLGVLAVRRRGMAIGGLAGLGLVGTVAAASRPNATILAAVPSVAAAAAGIAALLVLLSRLPLRESVARTSPDHPVDANSDQLARPALARRTGDERRPFGSPVSQPLPARSVQMQRRRFVLAAGAAAAVAVVTAGAGALVQRARDVAQARDRLLVPAAATPAVGSQVVSGFSDIEGLSPLLTPNKEFYRIDTALRVPQIDPEGWSLRIHGRVDRELRLTFADLAGRDDLIEADITLACVSNEVGGPLAGGARWVGVPLAKLLAEAGVQAGADQVLTRSVDGWTCATPTADCQQTPNAMLALVMNGETLPLEHGFPVRMIVPGLYGYVSATKWIVDLELTTFAVSEAYWVQRGWDAIAPIQMFSRIDVPQPGRVLTAGTVVVAGVAHTGSAGIGAVEVRVDDRPWEQARVSPSTNTQLWRQWYLPWEAPAGQHELTVRAVDGVGRTQTQELYSPYPNAASGWHSVQVDVV